MKFFFVIKVTFIIDYNQVSLADYPVCICVDQLVRPN
jgi:hypothetical protein